MFTKKLRIMSVCALMSIALQSTSVHAKKHEGTVVYDALRPSQENANEHVFYVLMPEFGTLTVGIEGNDRFLTYGENSSDVSIQLYDKTSYISIDGGEKQYSVGLGTVCGTSISVVIDAYKVTDKKPGSDVLPKINIQAPDVCRP